MEHYGYTNKHKIITMGDEQLIVDQQLTFYIERISTRPNDTSNTLIKLVVTGEVSYENLKVYTRKRLGIEEDFELSYTPNSDQAHFAAFQRPACSYPFIRLYIVPLQEPGSKPWNLHNVIWSLRGPRGSHIQNSLMELHDEESLHYDFLQSGEKAELGTELSWLNYRFRALLIWRKVELFIYFTFIITTILFYCNLFVAIYPNFLQFSWFPRLLLIVSSITAGYVIFKRFLSFNPNAENRNRIVVVEV